MIGAVRLKIATDNIVCYLEDAVRISSNHKFAFNTALKPYVTHNTPDRLFAAVYLLCG